MKRRWPLPLWHKTKRTKNWKYRLMVLVEEEPDTNGYPDEMYWCSFKYALGLYLMGRLIDWQIGFKEVKFIGKRSAQ